MPFLSEIKSRPLYGRLQPAGQARRHIAAAEAEGARAILDAFADPEIIGRTTIVYTPGPCSASGPGPAPAAGAALSSASGPGRDPAPETWAGRLAALKPDALHVLPSVETALVRLAGLLATATMGTRLSVAGSESFIGQAVAAGAAHGIDHASIATEHRGSPARRVQCVHCKGFTANVLASPVRCAHCGLALLVRDHYSRRLGAFMGVSIDAEAPGEVPEAEVFAA